MRRALGRVEGIYYLRPGAEGRQELRLWLSPRRTPAPGGAAAPEGRP